MIVTHILLLCYKEHAECTAFGREIFGSPQTIQWAIEGRYFRRKSASERTGKDSDLEITKLDIFRAGWKQICNSQIGP